MSIIHLAKVILMPRPGEICALMIMIRHANVILMKTPSFYLIHQNPLMYFLQTPITMMMENFNLILMVYSLKGFNVLCKTPYGQVLY